MVFGMIEKRRKKNTLFPMPDPKRFQVSVDVNEVAQRLIETSGRQIAGIF
jgi:hypothetical protein